MAATKFNDSENNNESAGFLDGLFSGVFGLGSEFLTFADSQAKLELAQVQAQAELAAAQVEKDKKDNFENPAIQVSGFNPIWIIAGGASLIVVSLILMFKK